MLHRDERLLVFLVVNNDCRRVRQHCCVVNLFVELTVSPSDEGDPLAAPVRHVDGRETAVMLAIARPDMDDDSVLGLETTREAVASDVAARLMQCPRDGVNVGKVDHGTVKSQVHWFNTTWRRIGHRTQQQTVRQH